MGVVGGAMKTAAANVYDLARESVAVHLGRYCLRVEGLQRDYEALAKEFPTRPCTIHIEEAKAIAVVCRGLIDILLDPETELVQEPEAQPGEGEAP